MIHQAVIAKQSGQAFVMSKGNRIEIIDIEGQQIADLFAVCTENHNEFFSPGVSLKKSRTLNPQVLYSNKYRPMLTIEKDDVGVHDFLIPCCRQESYAFLKQGAHPNCLDNLNAAFATYKVAPFSSIDAMSIFMNVEITPDKSIKFRLPCSVAGNSIVLHAEMDLIVGVTACSDDISICNNRSSKPIGVNIY